MRIAPLGRRILWGVAFIRASLPGASLRSAPGSNNIAPSARNVCDDIQLAFIEIKPELM